MVAVFLLFCQQEVEQTENQANTYISLEKKFTTENADVAAHASNRILHVQHRRVTRISARSNHFFCLPFVCLFVAGHQTERIFAPMKNRIVFFVSVWRAISFEFNFFFCREKNLIHNNRKNGAQLYDADNELNTYFCVSMSTFQDLHDPESTGWDCNVCHGLWSSDVLCHSTKFSARKIIMLRWVMRIIMP